MDLTESGRTLRNLSNINVILGKNGCGKSQALRHFDQRLSEKPDKFLVKYLSPERGGQLAFDASVENQISGDAAWGPNHRRRNRVENFREMSFAEFRLLETLFLRWIERDQVRRADLNVTFDTVISKINALLDNVKLIRPDAPGFEVRATDGSEAKREPSTLSSGEAELLSVAIEILAFSFKCSHPDNVGKRGVLLLDEPDVHMHPDLQTRLMGLIADAMSMDNVTTIIATHSTAILGGLPDGKARVAFMSKGEGDLTFRDVNEELRRVLPVFGAHPLSNVFNQSPILLVEGDDDVRIWQQAARTARGRIRWWPCPAGDVQSLAAHELAASEIIGAVYDTARAYSLRDRDDAAYEIDDLTYVTRMRLKCRAAENLLLSDEVLAVLGTNWEELKAKITAWIEVSKSHVRYDEMSNFAARWDRRDDNIKNLRNTIVGITGAAKDWEIAVGQAIAGLTVGSPDHDGSLKDFLGPKVVRSLGLAN